MKIYNYGYINSYITLMWSGWISLIQTFLIYIFILFLDFSEHVEYIEWIYMKFYYIRYIILFLVILLIVLFRKFRILHKLAILLINIMINISILYVIGFFNNDVITKVSFMIYIIVYFAVYISKCIWNRRLVIFSTFIGFPTIAIIIYFLNRMFLIRLTIYQIEYIYLYVFSAFFKEFIIDGR